MGQLQESYLYRTEDNRWPHDQGAHILPSIWIDSVQGHLPPVKLDSIEGHFLIVERHRKEANVYNHQSPGYHRPTIQFHHNLTQLCFRQSNIHYLSCRSSVLDHLYLLHRCSHLFTKNHLYCNWKLCQLLLQQMMWCHWLDRIWRRVWNDKVSHKHTRQCQWPFHCTCRVFQSHLQNLKLHRHYWDIASWYSVHHNKAWSRCIDRGRVHMTSTWGYPHLITSSFWKKIYI